MRLTRASRMKNVHWELNMLLPDCLTNLRIPTGLTPLLVLLPLREIALEHWYMRIKLFNWIQTTRFCEGTAR